MIDLKTFREVNNLKQIDLASFLGTSRVFISQVESGKSKLPPEQLSKLLQNNKGWDISMLQEEIPEAPKEISIESVYRELINEKDSRITELKERIIELKETIAILKSEKGIQSIPATKDVHTAFVTSQNL